LAESHIIVLVEKSFLVQKAPKLCSAIGPAHMYHPLNKSVICMKSPATGISDNLIHFL